MEAFLSLIWGIWQPPFSFKWYHPFLFRYICVYAWVMTPFWKSCNCWLLNIYLCLFGLVMAEPYCFKGFCFFFLPFTHVYKLVLVYKRDKEHLMLSSIIFFISSLCRVLGSWHTLQVDGYLLPICIRAWPLEHAGHLLFIPRHHGSSTLVPRGFVFFSQTHTCKRRFARGFKGHLMLKSLHLRVTHK